MKLHENWTLQRMFFEIYSASKKLDIVICIILYKLHFNGDHLIGRNRVLSLKKPCKCVLKITALKPLKSFQNYFRVDVYHLW